MHVYQRHIHAEGDDSLSRIARLVPPLSRVLDVGCGSGALGRYLSANLKCTVDGITHNPDEAAEAAVGHRSIKVMDLDSQAPSSAFEPASYDVIVCADVLEHVRRSEAVLQDLRVLLAPKGKVLLSLPNVTHAGVVLSLISGKFVPTYEGLLDATHLHFFDREAVERLAAQSGFAITHLERVVRSLPQTEFVALNVDALPHAVGAFLLSGEEGSTYQFIAELLPLSSAIAPPPALLLPTRPPLAQKPQFAAQLYWRADGAYREESSLYAFGEIGAERQTLSFSLPADVGTVSHLRFDPADRPGVFELWEVTILDRDTAIVWSWNGSYNPALHLNGLGYVPSAQLLPNGGHTLVSTTDDPWFELTVPLVLQPKLAGAKVKLEMSWPRTADFAAFKYAEISYAGRMERANALALELSHALRLEQVQRAREQRAFDKSTAQQKYRGDDLESQVRLAGESLVVSQRRIEEVTNSLAQQKYRGDDLESQVRQLGESLGASHGRLQEVTNSLAEQRHRGDDLESQVRLLGENLAESQEHLQSVVASAAQDKLLAQTALSTLHFRETELHRIYRTWAWRLGRPLRVIERGLERAARAVLRRPAASAAQRLVEPSTQEQTFPTVAPGAASVDAPTETVLLFGSIDKLIIGSGALYTIGWFYHLTRPITGARLLFGDPSQPSQSIALLTHIPRPDVTSVNPHWLNATHCGWFYYGGICAAAQTAKTVRLLIEFESGETITQDISSKVELCSDESRAMARSASELFELAPKSVPLVIDHSMGGGANAYSKQLVCDLLRSNAAVMVLSFDLPSLSHQLRLVNGKSVEIASLSSAQDLLSFAYEQRFSRIIFNNAVSFSHAEEVPRWLLGLTEAARAPLVICIHDYFAICPSSFLLDNSSRYCDIPSVDKCRTCLPAIEQPMVRLYRGAGIEQWRADWERCLAVAQDIVCFSQSSQRLLLKAYPQLPVAKLSLQPHQVALPQVAESELVERQISSDQIRLGIVGHISEHKGAAVVARLYAAIEQRELSVPITVIGSFEGSAAFHVTGPYKQNELAQTLAAHRINLVLFPSICPETFSYVLHELRALDMPIIAFDLGAQADIVGHAPNGLVLPLAMADEGDQLLDAVLEFAATLSSPTSAQQT